jgi:hypothetical protein
MSILCTGRRWLAPLFHALLAPSALSVAIIYYCRYSPFLIQANPTSEDPASRVRLLGKGAHHLRAWRSGAGKLSPSLHMRGEPTLHFWLKATGRKIICLLAQNPKAHEFGYEDMSALSGTVWNGENGIENRLLGYLELFLL